MGVMDGDAAMTETCRRCGSDNPPWSAPSPLWNFVMRGNDMGAEDRYDGMVCIRCFTILAEEMEAADLWRLEPQRVKATLTTTTRDGRTWDPDAWLWVDTPEPS